MKHCLPPAVLDSVTPPKNVFNCFKNTGIRGDQVERAFRKQQTRKMVQTSLVFSSEKNCSVNLSIATDEDVQNEIKLL